MAASWRGIDYFRAVAEPSAKPATEAQLKQRRIFAVAMLWLKPILDLINIGYQSTTTAKTPMNAALSYHMKAAVVELAEDYGIDFSKAIFSKGELLTSFVKEWSSLEDGLFYVKWEDAAESWFAAASDLATYIVYNPVKETFVTFKDVANRADKETLLQLPQTFVGDELHVYLYYVSRDGKQVSTSLYLGKNIL